MLKNFKNSLNIFFLLLATFLSELTDYFVFRLAWVHQNCLQSSVCQLVQQLTEKCQQLQEELKDCRQELKQFQTERTAALAEMEVLRSEFTVSLLTISMI